MKQTIATLTIVAATLGLAACSSDSDSDAAPKSSAAAAQSTTTAAAAATSKAAASADRSGLYGVTPDGLTTAVNVPVNMSDAEFAEGCAQAKEALAMFGNDVEVTLALMQATAEDSTENFTVESEGAPWAEATPEEQAQIIHVVNAAARGEC